MIREREERPVRPAGSNSAAGYGCSGQHNIIAGLGGSGRERRQTLAQKISKVTLRVAQPMITQSAATE
jgi:hypothetical protein